MTLSRPDLTIVNFGDIHLGHRQNTTPEIIKNLISALPDNAETAKIDILLFGGDVFDLLLTLSNGYVPLIQQWIARTLKLAKKHNIMVRVLKGTPGHDWEQSQLWESINAIADIGADLKYVKTIQIEYIEQYGISVLYVPDEANSTTEKTLNQVRDIMRAKGLDQVDFALMHGQFDYQLPDFIPAQKHDSQAYLALVRELIFVAHVHTHSRYDRIRADGVSVPGILVPGSTDRLKHGEEEAKGHLRVFCSKSGNYDVRFIENKTAKKFVTISCKGMTLESTMQEVDEKVKGLPDDSYVRIEADHDNPILLNIAQVVMRHPQYNWNKISRKEKLAEQESDLVEQSAFTQITLTEDNLSDILFDRIMKTAPRPEVLEAARRLMMEVM